MLQRKRRSECQTRAFFGLVWFGGGKRCDKWTNEPMGGLAAISRIYQEYARRYGKDGRRGGKVAAGKVRRCFLVEVL